MGSPESVEGLHISPFGVIPKGHQTGKWQLVVDPRKECKQRDRQRAVHVVLRQCRRRCENDPSKGH